MDTSPDTHSNRQYRIYRWWHAALFWTLVSIPGFIFSWREELFPGYREPPLRPPGFLFPIIWFCINVCILWAGLRILNNRSLHQRALHITFQALFWLDFLVFPYFFFEKSSSIIGGLLTIMIFFFILPSVAMLWTTDRKSSLLMLPLLLWSAFAGFYLSVWQVMHNPDPYLGLPALMP